jgi:putative glutamine amidotransferase
LIENFYNDLEIAVTALNRPRIAILGRLAEGSTSTRSRAIVSARALVEAVWNAGGEPVTLLPTTDTDWATRLRGFSAVLMPGGGDLNPELYGQTPESDELYGIDPLQDASDLSLTKWAIENKVPFLAICRGFQLVNVAFGGNLVQHMQNDHRHVVHKLHLDADADRLGVGSGVLESSCYHHQAIDQLGEGLRVIARAEEGHVEALAIDNGAWAYAVQWHPEDNAAENEQQAGMFSKFVEQAQNAPLI